MTSEEKNQARAAKYVSEFALFKILKQGCSTGGLGSSFASRGVVVTILLA